MNQLQLRDDQRTQLVERAGIAALRPGPARLHHRADMRRDRLPQCLLLGEMPEYPWLGQAYRSEEHTSELQSLMRNSYAVFCLNKKKEITKNNSTHKQIRLKSRTHKNQASNT